MFRSKSTPRYDTQDLRWEGESSRLVNQTLASKGKEEGREGGLGGEGGWTLAHV